MFVTTACSQGEMQVRLLLSNMPDASARINGHLIRAVIYDFGEVLSYPPPPETIAALAALLHITPEKFREYYYAERQAYDRGELSAEQYWQAVSQDAGTLLTPEQIEWARRTDVAMWSNIESPDAALGGAITRRGNANRSAVEYACGYDEIGASGVHLDSRLPLFRSVG